MDQDAYREGVRFLQMGEIQKGLQAVTTAAIKQYKNLPIWSEVLKVKMPARRELAAAALEQIAQGLSEYARKFREDA